MKWAHPYGRVFRLHPSSFCLWIHPSSVCLSSLFPSRADVEGDDVVAQRVLCRRGPVSLFLDGAEIAIIRRVVGLVETEDSVGAGGDDEKDVKCSRRMVAGLEVRNVVLAFAQRIVGIAVEVG